MRIVMYMAAGWNFASHEFAATHSHVSLHGELNDLAQVCAHSPDLVFIGGFEANALLLNHVKQLCDKMPQTAVVIYADRYDAEFLMLAMRDGVREVISKNVSAELEGAIERAELHLNGEKSALQPAIKRAQKVGFISAKGGDGATCIVANLAAALAKNSQKRIAVVDLSLSFGDLEIYLTNKTITHDLSDFVKAVDRLDATLLDLMIHQVKENLHLIPSASSLEDILSIDLKQVEKLIDILCRYYDDVFIDVGVGVDPISTRILEKLDKLILVSTSSIPSARRCSQILHMWEDLSLAPDKVKILISRAGGPSDLDKKDYERVVGKKVWHTVYKEFIGIQESLLRGEPVVDIKPASRFSEAIIAIADEMNGDPIKRKFSLWRFLGIK